MGSAAGYLVIRASLIAESDAALLARANTITAFVKQDEGKIEYAFPAALLAEFSQTQDQQHFEIRDSDGRLLRTSEQGGPVERQADPRLRKTPSFWATTLGAQPARSVGFLFSPQQEENDENGKKISTLLPVLSLVVTQGQTVLNHTLQRLFTVLVGVGSITLVGTALLVAITVRVGLRPLDQIGLQAMRIDASSLDTRFVVEAVPVEMRSVCERLNDLLSRLDASFRREQRFSADVAHELRTPVAELRSLAEVALKWAPGKAETDALLQDTRDIALKMDGIVTGLLALVRCEEGRHTLRREAFALGPLVEKAWTSHSDRAKLQNFKTSFQLQGDLVVFSDAAAVEIILTNLFSNALEYTSPRGDIEIAAQRENGQVVITCLNSHADLDPEDLPHLCERFWRKDVARHDPAHSGLGLAICQKFAEVLGVELRFEIVAASWFKASLFMKPQDESAS